MTSIRSIRRTALAGLIGLSVLTAACAEDTKTSSKPDTTLEAANSGAGASADGPTGPGCAAVPEDGSGSFAGMAQDPAATAASNNPLLSTLVAAVGAAGLGDTLNGPGPFTIFAPTNDAFNKIPKADLDAVLADKATLTKILTLHVVAGKMSAAELATAGTATTVEGSDITFSGDASSLKVNGQAAVVCGDVQVANATVHIIDTVLMPEAANSGAGASADGPTGPGCAAVPEDGSGSFAGMAQDPAATAASNNPLLSTLVAAVGAAGLGDTLNGPGPFTIFAPTNDAFNKIPKADLDAVLADKATLTKILTLHVVAGKMSAADLATAGTATTVEGSEITFSGDASSLKVNGQAAVVCGDVQVANATVHIIDTVLMP